MKSNVRILRRPGYVRASYDSAATTNGNSRRWQHTDALSADAAASPSTRKIQRQRSRYVFANNSYASGIIQTLANDTIGTGPRLQLLTNDPKLNRQIELEFSAWVNEVGLPEKLRTMRMSRVVDGEIFAILTTNPNIYHPIKLDVVLVEADRVCSPVSKLIDDEKEIDGVILDEFGYPSKYRVLKTHPGTLNNLGLSDNDFINYDAEAVIHQYRVFRPGQHRGISEIAPALETFEMLRSYEHATLTAAEIAAEHAIVIKQSAPAPGEEYERPAAYDLVELEHGMANILPAGCEISQLQPSQPTATFKEFSDKLLNGIARCLNMPFNIAAGNSSGYNYSSGRLDHQTYYKSIRVDQAFIGSSVLDRILYSWLLEYSFTSGSMLRTGGHRLPPHQWFWDGHEHVDPLKEANAQRIRLENHTTTYSAEYARQGQDWEEVFDQIEREQAALRARGIVIPLPKQPEQKPAKKDEEDEDGE